MKPSLKKCFNLGRLIASDYNLTWEELSKIDDWKRWAKEREVDEDRLEMVRMGIQGLPFPEEFVMPIGKLKGWKWIDVPDNYKEWLSAQEWLPKFPQLKSKVDEFMSSKSSEIPSQEQIKEILKL